MASVSDLQLSLQSLQKDVDSKASTIKHLQNALDAKSMTIGILTKVNKEGGDIEEKVTTLVKTKTAAVVQGKDDEIAKLAARVQELESSSRGANAEEAIRLAVAEATAKTQQKLDDAKTFIRRVEGEKVNLAHQVNVAQRKLTEEVAAHTEVETERDALRAELEPLLMAAAERERAIEAERLARVALEEAKLRAGVAEQKAEEVQRLAESKLKESDERLELQKKHNTETFTEMRNYQAKAFELKNANDVMTEQLEGCHEEMRMLVGEYEERVHQLEKELKTVQDDRDSQWQKVTEQIDSRVKEIRKVAEEEKKGLLDEQVGERESERRRLRELTVEADRMRLKCDAQELELKALREAFGDVDGVARKSIAPQDATDANSEQAPRGSVGEMKRMKVRELREQSKFAFDEMTNRIGEVREEAEAERKRLQADFEQKLSQRGAKILELSNANDIQQTQIETLELSRNSLVNQRDELTRELRDKERDAELTMAEVEGLTEGQKLLQARLAGLTLKSVLMRSAVGPAFFTLRQNLGSTNEAGENKATAPQTEEMEYESTAEGDAEGLEDVEEDEEEDDEEENTYGTDQEAQEEWAELLQSNTLASLFTGASVVVQHAGTAADDLQEHIQNITSSIDLFPQIYAVQLQVLDRVGKGKDLRSFILIMQRAMARCQRISTAVFELSRRSEDFFGALQNAVRSRSLEWHLRGLRTASQHEILYKLQRNHMASLKKNYEDVLDQYGEQCELTTDLEMKSGDLEKRVGELTREVASLRTELNNADELKQRAVTEAVAAAASTAAQPRETTGRRSTGVKSMAEVRQLLGEIQSDVARPSTVSTQLNSAKDKEQETQAAPPTVSSKGKGKGKAPPPPAPGMGNPPPSEEAVGPTEKVVAETATAEGASSTKGKGKTKATPPPAPGASAPADTPTPPPKGKGSGPAKGAPPPAPGKGTPPPAPGKGAPPPAPGKGDKPPPPGKGKGGGPSAPGAGKGKGGKKGGSAIPQIDPGPAPPKDLMPKKFHWTNVTGNRFGTSVFAKIVEDMCGSSDKKEEGEEAPKPVSRMKRLKVDLHQLTNHFFARKKAEPTPEELAKLAAGSKKKAVATCIDAKRTQGIEIFLNGAGVTVEQVKSCVLDLNEKAIAIESLQQVGELFPGKEEYEMLENFRKDNDPAQMPWGRAEKFCLALMDISNFLLRSECCVIRGKFQEEFENVDKEVGQLKLCLKSVCGSTAITAIMAMVMQIGNFLNHGTNMGARAGFTLDTLALLMRVEGFDDKSYTLMRFMMDSLETDKRLRDEAIEDMKLCEASSRLDFTESVRQLTELEKNVSKVADAVVPAPEATVAKIGDPQFESAMRVFVTNSQKQLGVLRESVEEVTELCKQCVDMYAEKPKTPIGETLTKFAHFRKDMEEARRQNLLAKVKKEKAEKRRNEEKAKKEKAEKAKAAALAKGNALGGNGTGIGEAPPAVAADAEPAGAAVQMRKLHVKIPEKPHLAHALPRGGAASGSGAHGKTPSGTSSLPLPSPRGGTGSSPLQRPSMGPGASAAGRPSMGHGGPRGGEMLRASATGRISIAPTAHAASGSVRVGQSSAGLPSSASHARGGGNA
eukprot:TRINITY_DN33156_c1_g1_i1.p1 TRINITY_DN33156_c1_g1~~TRINITY_DN33156_c1_g1_i1.p1  ORF type:complete len:1639 (+),score=436.28 TRINITY_DN33156_c1_g1_i1:144-4919(+)